VPMMGPASLRNDIRGLALCSPWVIISTGGGGLNSHWRILKTTAFLHIDFLFKSANEIHYIHRNVPNDPVYLRLG